MCDDLGGGRFRVRIFWYLRLVLGLGRISIVARVWRFRVLWGIAIRVSRLLRFLCRLGLVGFGLRVWFIGFR